MYGTPAWHGSDVLLDSARLPQTKRQKNTQLHPLNCAPLAAFLSGGPHSAPGEKRKVREEGDDKGNVHVRERRYGSFQRAFTLPKSVTTEKIKAEFDNGILTVRMPKTEQAKSRTIEIKNSN